MASTLQTLPSLLATGTVLLALLASQPTNAVPTNIASSDCPKECVCVDDNRVVNCSHRGLVRLPPLPAAAVTLDLSGNLLGPMINGSFEHLRQLQEVDLSHNSFLRLQLCTFTGLFHLRRVDLHGNRLRSLPTGLFADNGDLEVLDLSHNEMDALPDLLLLNAPLLKVLNVSHNRATHLKVPLRFQRLRHLRLLDLSHNPFNNATEDAFEYAVGWDPLVARSLDLSHCQLRHVHPDALKAVPGLKNLSLSGNPLLTFDQVVAVIRELETSGLERLDLSGMNVTDPGLFSEVRLMALRALDLSGNRIESVPEATFGNIRSLRHLDLSGNRMTALGQGFEDLINLVELNVSHCRLSSFKGPAVGRMSSLTSLDLSHNRLLEASEVDLSALTHLGVLDLSFNTLQSVVLPGDASNLRSINFASNALTTLPSMANMRSLRFFDIRDNNLQSLSAFLFTDATQIKLVNFSRNDLTSIDHRAFLPASPEVIDLSHNYLTATQFLSWTHTKEVYLQNNRLNHMDQQTFYGMDRLRVLHLGNNNLSSISDQTFQFLTNLTTLTLSNNSLQMTHLFPLLGSLQSLRTLDLAYNLLESLNSTSFKNLASLKSVSLRRNRLAVISPELFKDIVNLEEVDISGNPFDCDCQLLPLQGWLRETKVAVRQRFDLNLTNTCVQPPEHAGKSVKDFTVEQFQCDKKLLYLTIFGSVGGLGIIVGVITSLVCHYCSRGRKTDDNDDVHRPRHRRKKNKDNADWKENNRSKVDLVRISKRADPYGKQELVNGWVNSKHLTVVGKNVDPEPLKNQQKGPPRPPWPERLSGRSRRDEKGGRGGREKDEGFRSGWESDNRRPRRDGGDERRLRRESEDRRIRSVSELVPQRAVQPMIRSERTRSMVPAWESHYPEKYPPAAVNLKRLPDRWESIEAYPTWVSPRAMRMAYGRDDRRFYTLPYPAPWPRYPPYGPDYPYRSRRVDQDEELGRRARQPRALPCPPRDPDYIGPSHRQPYPGKQHRQYENLPEGWDRRDPRYRNDQEERDPRYRNDQEDRDPRYRNVQEERDPRYRNGQDEKYREVPNPRYHRSEYENVVGPADDRTAMPGQGNEVKGERSEKGGPSGETKPMRRGTSDVEIHRRDSEYRNAMDNPIGPKAQSTPLLAEDTASDWL